MALNGSASINHQIIIAYLNTNINNFLFVTKNKNFKNLVSTTETKFEFSLGKKVIRKESDILVFNKTDYKEIFIWIEISKKIMVARDKSKINLIFKKNTNLQEGFVYDYENNIWYKRTRNNKFQKSDVSNFLSNTNLSKFIYSINSDVF